MASSLNASSLPLIVPASSDWSGNDGNWSTFDLAVGSPAQSFKVLPSTLTSETWVPVSEGCSTASDLLACAGSRGVGYPNLGFQTNASTTWSQIGIYELTTEQKLYGDAETGLYGLDTVSLNGTGSPHKLENQTVAGIATADFWLGSFGLGIQASEFSVLPSGVPSLLSSIRQQKLIPSLSFGYTAGASYISSPGHLVLGGYDQSRIADTVIEGNLGGHDNLTLEIALKSIVASNSLQGTRSVPTGENGISIMIDSTVSQLWLPQDACDTLEAMFGLTNDADTGLYLVNDTMHTTMSNLAPEITFTVASNSSSNSTTNIVFPWSALEMNMGAPLFNTSTRYFPMRRAANETQYTLGRAFLQEGYIIVDWERRNFTLGHSIHPTAGSSPNIVPILSLDDEVTQPHHASGLSVGVIAGIVVAVATIVAVMLAIVLILRKRSRRRREADANAPDPLIDIKESEKMTAVNVAELHGEHHPGIEAGSSPVHELQDEQLKHQLMSREVYELPGYAVERELEGSDVRLLQEQTKAKPPEIKNS